jgi:hypothetical protein
MRSRFRGPSAVLALFCPGVLLLPSAAGAVNLVPNPSFESYVSCPTGYSQFYQTVSWNEPNAGTSDLFNACSPGGFPSVNVPANTSGYQNALTGVGYAGIIPYSAAPDYREYVQAQLSSPLVNGNTYLVSFWVSLGDTSSIAIDRLGAHFPVGQIGPLGSNTTLLVTPQVESPANVFLTNSTGWTQISGTFVAAGGESHIVIGSFRDDASTNTVPGPSNWPGGSYYYIDDVSVELVPNQVDQACCLPGGGCVLLTPNECAAQGGTSLGPGVACNPGPDDPCGPTPTLKRSWGSIKGTYR